MKERISKNTDQEDKTKLGKLSVTTTYKRETCGLICDKTILESDCLSILTICNFVDCFLDAVGEFAF